MPGLPHGRLLAIAVAAVVVAGSAVGVRAASNPAHDTAAQSSPSSSAGPTRSPGPAPRRGAGSAPRATSGTTTTTTAGTTAGTATGDTSPAAGETSSGVTTAPVHAKAVSSFPDASSTGAHGSLRHVRGPLTLSKRGQVLSNVAIDGRVTVNADHVTLRNVKISADDFWVLLVSGSHLTVEDATLTGTGRSEASIGVVGRGSFIARRADISGAPDGVKMGPGSQLVDSYIHDLAAEPGAHNDGVEINNGRDTQVLHNTIVNPRTQTSAIMMNDPAPKDAAIVVAGNLLAGGGYTIYGGSNVRPTGIVVRDNAFSVRYYPKAGYYGPRAYWSDSGNTWAGNYWIDGPEAGSTVS